MVLSNTCSLTGTMSEEGYRDLKKMIESQRMATDFIKNEENRLGMTRPVSNIRLPVNFGV